MEQDNSFKLLKSIDTPDDLRKLKTEQLPEVCKELRQKIIDELSCNPGHFASSLGVVELTVALETVYDTAKDRLVFDVGHQCYTHKLLTGRYEAFQQLREKEGCSGFPSPGESPCDPVVGGHSGSALSAALGISAARELENSSEKVLEIVYFCEVCQMPFSS